MKCAAVGALLAALTVLCADTSGNCPVSAPACEVLLNIDAGRLCGRVRRADDGTPYASFRGVPYAKPPLGERRFVELEPPEPWDHLFDATEESAACPQKDFIYSRIPLQIKGMSEDCIYLNLHMPLSAVPSTDESKKNDTKEARASIMVFVHGGGFQAGSGLTDLYGPEFLMRKDIIVITFNFRNNVFGFLSLNSSKIPGNQALRDIVTLLRWVQRNALALGGNPNDVTLAGHSSGASLAHLVSLSESAKGLFNKVILMSGTGIPNYFSASKVHAKLVADKLVAVLGINSTDADYIHDRLTREPLLNIMSALATVQYKSDIVVLNLVPVVESKFPNVTRILDDEPLALIAKGRGKECPVIIGFTTGEFQYFKGQLLNVDIMERIEEDPTVLVSARLRYDLPPNEVLRLGREVMDWYFKGSPDIERVLDIYSDLYFVQPALLLAEWRALAGASVYLYQFSYESERSVIKESLWATYSRVAHVEDLTYVFRTNSILQDYVSYPPKNKDDLMREWMPSIIVNFVRCSNPTCTKEETAWPPVTPGNICYQDIADPGVYAMKNLTAQQRDTMQLYYEKIDTELRNVREQILKQN